MTKQIQLAKRALVKPDPIDTIFQQIPSVNQARAERNLGEIISLAVGEPHLPINKNLLQHLAQFLLKDGTAKAFSYSPLEGREETLQALHDLYKAYYPKANYHLDEVMLCNGATQALSDSFNLLLEADDIALAFEPCYSAYKVQVEQLGGRFVKVSTLENGFRPSGKLLQEALDAHPEAKVLILNYPNNPSGINLTKAEVNDIATVLMQYPKLAIVCDEVYRELSVSEHYSILDAQPSLKDRCIMINSASKGLIGAPDLRIGMLAANSEWIKSLISLQATAVSSPNLLSQVALNYAVQLKLQNDISYTNWLQASRKEYAANIHSAAHAFKKMGCDVVYGGNGFFLLMRATPLLGKIIPSQNLQEQFGHDVFKTDVEITQYFLQEAGVAVIPGSAFGIDEKLGYLRISCAKSRADLDLALLHLAKAVHTICGEKVKTLCSQRFYHQDTQKDSETIVENRQYRLS